MRVLPDSRLRVAPNVHSRSFDRELILLDLARGRYFGLNEFGARAWCALTSGLSPEQFAEVVSTEYDIDPTQLATDVVALAEELMASGLLVPEESGAVA